MDTLKLSLVQSNLAWQDAAANRGILEALFADAASGTDLVLLPEMFTSAFSMESGALAEPWPGESVAWMQAMAQRHDAAFCGSIAITDDGRRFNRLVFVTPEGETFYYDKRHLFRMLGEHKRYAAGSERRVIEWQGWRILPLVCYDLRFPVWSRNTPALAYDLLLYVANWPAPRNHHWQALLTARAIENLACVAGVNRIGTDGIGIDYVGHSMAVNAAGKVLLDAGEAAGVFTITLDKAELQQYRHNFPAHLDADDFELR